MDGKEKTGLDFTLNIIKQTVKERKLRAISMYEKQVETIKNLYTRDSIITQAAYCRGLLVMFDTIFTTTQMKKELERIEKLEQMRIEIIE